MDDNNTVVQCSSELLSATDHYIETKSAFEAAEQRLCEAQKQFDAAVKTIKEYPPVDSHWDKQRKTPKPASSWADEKALLATPPGCFSSDRHSK